MTFYVTSAIQSLGGEVSAFVVAQREGASMRRPVDKPPVFSVRANLIFFRAA